VIKRTFTFICPVCRKVYRTDEGIGEPCCTGPSEMRDDHELTIMHLHGIDHTDIDPQVGEARANGPLIIHA